MAEKVPEWLSVERTIEDHNMNVHLRRAYEGGNLAALYDAIVRCHPCPDGCEPFSSADGFLMVPRWVLLAAREHLVRIAQLGSPGSKGRLARFVTRYRQQQRDNQCWGAVETARHRGVPLPEAIDIAAEYLNIPASTIKTSRLRALKEHRRNPYGDMTGPWFQSDVIESDDWKEMPITLHDWPIPEDHEIEPEPAEQLKRRAKFVAALKEEAEAAKLRKRRRPPDRTKTR